MVVFEAQLSKKIQIEGVFQTISTVYEPIGYSVTEANKKVTQIPGFQVLGDTGNGGL